ncbi:MAG TPA: response regulator, partial [Polyangiaceae bacterium]|nr:response regulator [Polyangiaceae bacterium]
MINPTILVIDDSPTVRMGLKATFLEVGIKVEIAAGLAEAEAQLDRSSFALVVLDRHLPDGETLPLLRRLTTGHFGKPTPVIMISGSDKIEARLDALALGADFIAKPCDPRFIVDRAAALATLELSERTGARPCRVLVIDDSATYGNAVAVELRRGGHDVVLAATAAEGLRYLSLQKPDRVVIDVFLPDADGIELARRVRELSGARELPLLLLTGRESSTTRKRAADAGVTAFLTKDSPLSVLGAWVLRPLSSFSSRGLPAGGVASDSSESGTRPVALASSLPGGGGRGSHDELFERVVAASGLSTVLGSSTLKLALRRSGADPEHLTPESLARALEQIE